MKNTIALALSLATLSACTPITANRGNLLEDYQMKEVVPGQDSRDEVIRKIGSPTEISAFNDNIWYYLGQKTEKRGIFDPKITEERIVVVTFGQDGLVDSIKERKDGREDVSVVQRKTPTSGNEITFVQQMLGNLGKFNKQDTTNAAQTAGTGTVGGGNR